VLGPAERAAMLADVDAGRALLRRAGGAPRRARPHAAARPRAREPAGAQAALASILQKGAAAEAAACSCSCDSRSSCSGRRQRTAVDPSPPRLREVLTPLVTTHGAGAGV